jgi:hypothetical protein
VAFLVDWEDVGGGNIKAGCVSLVGFEIVVIFWCEKLGDLSVASGISSDEGIKFAAD